VSESERGAEGKAKVSLNRKSEGLKDYISSFKPP
jgi:hypothetical protein